MTAKQIAKIAQIHAITPIALDSDALQGVNFREVSF